MSDARFGLRTVRLHVQSKRFSRLLAAREHGGRGVKRCRYSKRIPGAVGVVLLVVNAHNMLGGDAGEWRRHANGNAIRFQHKHAIIVKAAIALLDLLLADSRQRRHFRKAGRSRRLRDVLVDR